MNDTIQMEILNLLHRQKLNFYLILTINSGVGPKGDECKIDKLEIGDIIQLSFKEKNIFLFIGCKIGNNTHITLIAAHTYDIFGKSVSEYGYEKYRCLYIK